MLTISKPLSAGQAQRYHAREFTSPEQAYYSQEGEVLGAWHGHLAAEWGLTGAVTALAFARLAEGQHPETGAQLVRHRHAFLSTTAGGERIRTMEHRAAWDPTARPGRYRHPRRVFVAFHHCALRSPLLRSQSGALHMNQGALVLAVAASRRVDSGRLAALLRPGRNVRAAHANPPG